MRKALVVILLAVVAVSLCAQDSRGKQLLLAKGMNAVNEKKFDEAIKYLKDLLKQYGDSDLAYYLLGICYKNKNYINDAESNFYKAVGKTMNADIKFESLVALADIHFGEKEYEDCIRCVEEASTIYNARNYSTAMPLLNKAAEVSRYRLKLLQGTNLVTFKLVQEWPRVEAEMLPISYQHTAHDFVQNSKSLRDIKKETDYHGEHYGTGAQHGIKIAGPYQCLLLTCCGEVAYVWQQIDLNLSEDEKIARAGRRLVTIWVEPFDPYYLDSGVSEGRWVVPGNIDDVVVLPASKGKATGSAILPVEKRIVECTWQNVFGERYYGTAIEAKFVESEFPINGDIIVRIISGGEGEDYNVKKKYLVNLK